MTLAPDLRWGTLSWTVDTPDSVNLDASQAWLVQIRSLCLFAGLELELVAKVV